MKYLHRFKWNNLVEQMNYEKITKDQRLRLEMGRVKKESEFFARQMDEVKRRKRKGLQTDQGVLEKRTQFYESRQRKSRDPSKETTSITAPGVDSNLLAKIFG